jgi:hypothetical protein
MLGELLLSTYLAFSNSQNPDSTTSPITYSDNLKVNITNDVRYISKKSESEGVTDLKKLSEESIYEEAWIFTPQDSLWHEVGIEETGWKNNIMRLPHNSVNLDKKYLDELSSIYKKLVLYHIHPVKNPMLYRYPSQGVLISTKSFSCIPSDRDIITSRRYATFSHKIVSSIGITAYGPTKESIAQKDTTFEKNIGKDLNDMVVSYDSTITDIEEASIKSIHKTLSQWKSYNAWIEFTPFRGMLFKEE